MFKISGVLCLVVAIVFGSLLFQTSQSVQRAEQSLAAVKGDVQTEKESLRILTAEWDYLNRPERLEKLTLQNLDMDEGGAERASFIGGGNAVPEPRVPALPQVKPENLYQQVSLQGRSNKVLANGFDLIESAEGEKFDTLVVVGAEGQE